MVETGESLLVPNALECEYAVAHPNSEEIDESLAAVPLRYGSRVTGAIVISKLGLNQFDEDDIRLLEVLAGQASVALENARLYDQQRREALNAKALLAFLDEVSQAQSFDEICTRTVETAATLFESPVVSLWLQDGAGDFYRAASCGSPELVDRRPGNDERRPSRARMARAVPGRDGPRGAAPGGRRRDRMDRGREGQSGCGPGGRAAAARGVLVPGVGCAPEGPALLAAARGCRDRERAARREPGAGDRRLAGSGAQPGGRGHGARARHDRASLWIQRRRHRTISSRARGSAETLDELRAPIRRERAEKWLQTTEPFLLEAEQVSEINGVPAERMSRLAVAPLRLESGRSAR